MLFPFGLGSWQAFPFALLSLGLVGGDLLGFHHLLRETIRALQLLLAQGSR